MYYQKLSHSLIKITVVLLFLVGCSALPATPVPPTAIPTTPTPAIRLGDKQVLFVIYNRFEESEYGIPRAILEDERVIITVASTSLNVLTGHQGIEVQPNVALSDVQAVDYDAIVFIGGYEYNRDDLEAQRIAQEAVAEGRLLAAICVAPITLAKAGVVEGKRVTASTGFTELKEAGAILSTANVERDGLIITANGPAASREFGEAIAAMLALSPE